MAPTVNLARLASPDLLATEEMKAHPDQKDPKGGEESKELQETEARWGRGEKMVWQVMERPVVLVSRVILGPADHPVTRVPRELLDPKEMTEIPEIQAAITTNQDLQDLTDQKVTEDQMAIQDLLGPPDHRELMNVKSWISS
ncbi:uncharacterized protein ACO6RY_14344 [Pungitius sinensis]